MQARLCCDSVGRLSSLRLQRWPLQTRARAQCSLLSMAIVLALSGCATTDRDWDEALHLGTESAFESFLAEHPHAKQTNDARRLLKEKRVDQDWRKADSSGEIRAYEHFLDIHPESKRTVEAEERLRELRYARAKKLQTAAGLEAFLCRYPAGVDADTLRTELPRIRLLETAWQTARQKNTVHGYKAFLAKYPDGEHAAEAKARMRIPKFNEAFGVTVDFTDEQIHTYAERLLDETYSTVIREPIEYYIIDTSSRTAPEKSKKVIPPSEIQKACSLQLKAEDISIEAVYVLGTSDPPIRWALFPRKWEPTMTHNGFSGPGLEIRLSGDQRNELSTFLSRFAVSHENRDYNYDREEKVVIPDLLSGSDRDGTPYPHYGRVFTIDKPLVMKVEGVKGMPSEVIRTYDEALMLKTYLRVLCDK